MKFGFGRRGEFFPKAGERPRNEFPRNQVTRYQEVADSLMAVPNDQALAMGFNTAINPSTGEPHSHPGYMFGHTSQLHLTTYAHLKIVQRVV